MAVGCGHGIDHFYPETIPFTQCAKNLNIAGSLTPEAVIVSDEELAQPEPAAKHELDEVFGRERGQLRGKWEDCDVVDPRFRENFELLVLRRQEERGGRRIYDLEGVRLECDQDARDLERARPRNQALNDIAMPAMNAVERSYRYDRALDVRG
jgi:hypothetical protein